MKCSTHFKKNAEYMVHMRKIPEKKAVEKLMNAEHITHMRNTLRRKN